MKINKNILAKHLHDAAIEQIAAEYQENDYEVQKEAKLGNLVSDLIAKKDNELIVFEFKYGEWNKQKIKSVSQLRNYVVQKYGASFKLVLINPLEGASIEVENLKQVFQEIIINNSELYSIHNEVSDVSNITISKVVIRKNEIELLGFAIVTMPAQDNSYRDLDFLLDFHIILVKNFEVEKIIKFDLDTSDYYDYQNTIKL